MPRPQNRIKLSSCHVALIETHYEEIRSRLKIKLIKSYGMRRFEQENLLDRSVGYIVDVTPQFDPEGGCSYVRYCVERCAYKLIDEYRQRRMARSKEKKRIETKENIVKTVGYANDEDVVEELEKQGMSNDEVNDIMTTHVEVMIPMTTLKSEDRRNGREESSNSFADFCDESGSEGIERIEWSETKKKIILAAKLQLPHPYYVLIRHYVLPKIENSAHKTLIELSKIIGLSASRLSQIITDDKMKAFFKEVLIPEENCQPVAA